MKILTVDVGTGTQDIFLYDSSLDVENGFKLVIPSPTMIIHRRIQAATRARTPILLSGVIMGGGPSAWAAEAHAKAGIATYATPEAAKTLNDELDKVARAGIVIVLEEEAKNLPSEVLRLEFSDFDFALIAETFARFGVSLKDLSAVAVAVFDHGNAPPGVSDRQFRFDYLDERIRAKNALSTFAFPADEIPPLMTRMQAVAQSARGIDAPLFVMDTAPAAILGASFDPLARGLKHKLIANIGNFHALAFRLSGEKIEGVFEHHTGEINRPQLEGYLRALVDGSLTGAEIFDSMGHGALVYNKSVMPPMHPDFDVIVSGPRRSMLIKDSASKTALRSYFAVPFGDMMIAGNFGLLSAVADLLPNLKEQIRASLAGRGKSSAPWDAN